VQVTNRDLISIMNLLHIDSSIQGENSASRAVSAAVVARLRASDPSLVVTYRDLAREPLPHLTLEAMGAENPTVDAFLAADVVVIGVSMYNFSISSQLKAWIDRILVAGKTFSYGANGAQGLAGGKRVILAIARGGQYAVGGPLEHAETYLRGVLAFMGIIDPEVIIADGLMMGDEVRSASMAKALGEAQALAA
jgi:FMN-dependent NADH-azoreductase